MNVNVLIVLCTVFLFQGCLSRYSIEPSYNSINQTVMIDSVKFLDAKESSKFDPYVGGRIGKWNKNYKQYILKDRTCKKIFYRKMQSGSRAYISENFDDMLRAGYKKRANSNPKVTKINNLKFYEVRDRKRGNIYLIATDVLSQYSGYDSLTSIAVDRTCFNTLKRHFSKKAKKDGIKIENYNLVSK